MPPIIIFNQIAIAINNNSAAHSAEYVAVYSAVVVNRKSAIVANTYTMTYYAIVSVSKVDIVTGMYIALLLMSLQYSCCW